MVRGLAALLLLSAAATAQEPFPLGGPPVAGSCDDKVGNADACCWPGQKWSPWLRACVGTPRCPPERDRVGETCVDRCNAGRVRTEETAGRCCWPAQVYSRSQKRCIGIPVCPPGMSARGDECVLGCRLGQVATAETGWRCCWPRQAWSEQQNRCVGIPKCPVGWALVGDACIVLPSAVEPPPDTLTDNDRVTVRIVGRRENERYRVTVRGAAADHQCRTPCRMWLLPGAYGVTVKTPEGGSYKQEVIVADDGSTLLLVDHRRQPLRTGGAVMAALGPALVVGGLITVIASGAQRQPSLPGIVAGVPVLIIGFPTIAIGSSFIARSGNDRIDVRWIR